MAVVMDASATQEEAIDSLEAMDSLRLTRDQVSILILGGIIMFLRNAG